MQLCVQTLTFMVIIYIKVIVFITDVTGNVAIGHQSNFENEKASFYLLNGEDADFGYDLAEIREKHDIAPGTLP